MILRIKVAAAFFCLIAAALAQSAPIAGTTPEAGFVSSDKYTNAFFGFSLPLPQNASFRDLNLSSIFKGERHFLFGAQSRNNGTLTTITVSADQSREASRNNVRNAAAGPKHLSTKRIVIGEREFWKSASQEKSSAGSMQTITYSAGLNGYILQFTIISFDPKLADALSRNIEAITFLDPAKASQKP
jgi:hypothetical protein